MDVKEVLSVTQCVKLSASIRGESFINLCVSSNGDWQSEDLEAKETAPGSLLKQCCPLSS